MRIIADSNIQMSTVAALRADGHDVVWIMERAFDPGDKAILAEAFRSGRMVITLDKDFGKLAVVDGQPHCGIVLLDETLTLSVQKTNIRRCLERYESDLESGAFLRVTADGRVRRQKKK